MARPAPCGDAGAGKPMNIGQAAERSGVPAKTIRYYEDIGLISRPLRAENGYRAFSEADVHMLRFIARARGLGFSVREVGELLALYHDRSRASSAVKAVAEQAINRIDTKIGELVSMRSTLSDLAERCHGDQRPECPILDDLAGR